MKSKTIKETSGRRQCCRFPSNSHKNLSRRYDKRILIVTVGEQEKPIFEGLRVANNVDIVFLLASKFTENKAEEIKKSIEQIYHVQIVLIDEVSFDDIIKKIVFIHKENLNSEFLYNISGGTKIMSLACYTLASFLGEKVFYIFKKQSGEMELIRLPTLKINLDFLRESLSGKKLKFLELIKEKPRTITELSKILKLAKPTISLGYVDKLEQQNLIMRTPSSKRSQKIRITEEGEILLHLKELFNENG